MMDVLELVQAKWHEEGRAQLQTEIALQLLRMGEFTLEKIAEITGLSLDAVRTIAEKNAH